VAKDDPTLGFRLVTLRRADAGGASTLARFQCVECGATHDEHIISGRPLNVEGLAKRAEAKGWKADARRRNRCWCPRCAGPTAKPKTPDTGTGKVIPMAPQVAPIRDITSDQRLRVRALLDKHFDDGPGAYLDGMSDEKVAEQAAVPRIHVERIREAAYGPIRITPEMAEARAELEELRKSLTDGAAQLRAMEARFVKIEERVAKMAVGKAA
jgi:hypothetical protein